MNKVSRGGGQGGYNQGGFGGNAGGQGGQGGFGGNSGNQGVQGSRGNQGGFGTHKVGVTTAVIRGTRASAAVMPQWMTRGTPHRSPVLVTAMMSRHFRN